MVKKFEKPGIGFGGIGEKRIYQGVNQKRMDETWERIQHNERVRKSYCERHGIDLKKLNYAEKLEVMDKALEWNSMLGEALDDTI